MTISETLPNASSVSTGADGTVTTTTKSPDSRYGMMSPTRNVTLKTPSGLTMTSNSTRAVTLSNSADPLSVSSITDTQTVNAKATRTTFNKATMTFTTTTPMGKQITKKIDTQGRVVQSQVVGINPVAYSYDVNGRMSAVTQGTRTSAMAYDASGNLASVTDAMGRVVSIAYGSDGRITSKTLPDGRVIYFSYDANGNVTSITPPARPAHGFSYTPVDTASSYNPPAVAGSGATSTTYAYNLDKQVTRITRPDGQIIDRSYDTAGRLSTVTLPGAFMNYTYGVGGACCGNPALPQSVTRNSGGASQTLNYTYDGILLTSIAWSGDVNGSVSRTYDNNLRIVSHSVNGASAIAYSYDNDGLLGNAGLLAIARNTSNGIITGTTLGSATTTQTYSALGEMSGYTAKYGATSIYDTQFTRDALGRIARKVETVGGIATTFDYQYDTADRLVGVSKNGVAVSNYVYDNNGNRVTATQSGVVTQGFYDLQDRLVTYGTNSYTYTPNGELASKTANGQVTTYNYDVAGNIISFTMPDGTLIEYVIDGQNRRVGKKVNGALTQAWLYQNAFKPIAELDGSGNIITRFVYGMKAHIPDYMINGGVTYRVISDHLGSPRLVINTSTGAIAQQIDYDEFGNIVNDTAPGFQPFGFAGGIYDQHTKLTRHGARDYDAEVGRWTAKDPILFAGGLANIMSYVNNDPVNYYDITGLDETFVDGYLTTKRFGPRNGNWGGENWSGGLNPNENGGQDGIAPPLDSGDSCYMQHDKCYGNDKDKGKDKDKCDKKKCDKELVKCLEALPDDTDKWPVPPREGTEYDSDVFRKLAIRYFR